MADRDQGPNTDSVEPICLLRGGVRGDVYMGVLVCGCVDVCVRVWLWLWLSLCLCRRGCCVCVRACVVVVVAVCPSVQEGVLRVCVRVCVCASVSMS